MFGGMICGWGLLGRLMGRILGVGYCGWLLLYQMVLTGMCVIRLGVGRTGSEGMAGMVDWGVLGVSGGALAGWMDGRAGAMVVPIVISR